MKIRKYRGAGMIIYHRGSNGRMHLLLEERSDDHSWAIPGGGASTMDENLMVAAIRETAEETGIAVPSAVHITTYRLPFFTYAVFAAKLDDMVRPVRNWESESIRWFPVSALPEGMNFMTRIELRDFLKREGICGRRN